MSLDAMTIALPDVRRTWQLGLSDEVRFWDDYIRTRGLAWPDEFEQRIDPHAPLAEAEILQRLPAPASRPVRILDVGAGPLTTLGKRVPGYEVAITAVDPLADVYAALLEKYGVVAPVPTWRCKGEELTAVFPPATFDFAYARNALDHSCDPRTVIRQMLQVVRPGGWVVLRHRPNEAQGAGYAGLHQWNFDLQDGRFWIWNTEWRFNMHSVLATMGDLSCHREGEWLVCAIRRLSPAESLGRLAALVARTLAPRRSAGR